MENFYFYKIRNLETKLYYSKYNKEGQTNGTLKGISYSKTPNLNNMKLNSILWEIVRFKAVEDKIITK